MVSPLFVAKKIGFLGFGNLARAICTALLDANHIPAKNVYVSNRTPGKIQKAVEDLGVNGMSSNVELVEESDIVILSTKPQDMSTAIDGLGASFTSDKIVVSLAAGISLNSLSRFLPQTEKVVRVMTNTPVQIKEGVLGYAMKTESDDLVAVIEDLFDPLGAVIQVEEGEEMEALTVACGSGPGFLFELMIYWQEWLMERGFSAKDAKGMTEQTFLGAAKLAAAHENISTEDLQKKVVSAKGVTAAGLDSMRELDLERGLRISFEKAVLRDRELGKLLK